MSESCQAKPPSELNKAVRKAVTRFINMSYHDPYRQLDLRLQFLQKLQLDLLHHQQWQLLRRTTLL